MLANTINIIKTYQNFWQYFLPATSKLVSLTTRKPKYTFLVRKNLNDHWMLDDVYIHQDYGYFLNLAESFKVVIDVGAHIGGFTIQIAKKTDRILSLEPDPQTYEILCQNLQLNHITNAIPIQQALAQEVGEGYFYQSSQGSANSSLLKRPGQKIKVETINLAELIHKHQLKNIDILKIDCEGYEYQLLGSDDADSLKLAKYIVLEYHPNSNHDPENFWVRNKLEKLNFDLVAWPRQTTHKGVLIFKNKK